MHSGAEKSAEASWERAARVYDAVWALSAAWVRATLEQEDASEPPTGEEVLAQLEEVSFLGASGHCSWDEKGDLKTDRATVVILNHYVNGSYSNVSNAVALGTWTSGQGLEVYPDVPAYEAVRSLFFRVPKAETTGGPTSASLSLSLSLSVSVSVSLSRFIYQSLYLPLSSVAIPPHHDVRQWCSVAQVKQSGAEPNRNVVIWVASCTAAVVVVAAIVAVLLLSRHRRVLPQQVARRPSVVSSCKQPFSPSSMDIFGVASYL